MYDLGFTSYDIPFINGDSGRSGIRYEHIVNRKSSIVNLVKLRTQNLK